MKVKEYVLCVQLHHIATFVGLLSGICHMIMLWGSKDHDSVMEKPGRVISILLRMAGLILYVWNQLKAAKKIIDDFLTDDSRLRMAVQSIHEICDTLEEERQMLWGVTVISLLHKLTVPVILGWNHA